MAARISDLWKSLQIQDRLIKITIGTGQDAPIYVQQKMLECVAPWFENALKRETFIEGQTGVLYFPADDHEAWQVLVYWILKREFANATGNAYRHPAERFEVQVKCWVLGDKPFKYDIKKFQDEAMTALLEQFQTYPISDVSDEALNRIFKICPPGSKLAELVALEIARDIKDGRTSWYRARNLDLVNIWSDFCDTQLKSRVDAYVDTIDCEALVLKYERGGYFMVGEKVVAEVETQNTD